MGTANTWEVEFASDAHYMYLPSKEPCGELFWIFEERNELHSGNQGKHDCIPPSLPMGGSSVHHRDI